MNWFYRLEQKYGRKAIPNIAKFFIAISILGEILTMIDPILFFSYFIFDPAMILKGQVWRLFTWVLMPSGNLGSIWGLLFLFCLWMLARNLEMYIGSFKMNFYFLGSIVLFDIIGLAVYGITLATIGVGVTTFLTFSYTIFSLYLMLGLFMPDAEVRLYFVLPLKMKWLVILYFVTYAYELYNVFSAGIYYGLCYGSVIIVSVIWLLFFVFICKNRVSHKQKKRQRAYQANFEQPRPGSGIGHHKCVICGRTDETNPELTFRFCSKCAGAREYCNDHLFTHQHFR